jgi:hypothetical protein
LTAGDGASGRRFLVDPRCLAGEPILGAYAHVCASESPDAALPYDSPEVQEVRRAALAWWIPMLGDALVCLSTLALDSVRCGGAVTVARDPMAFVDDPFQRLFRGTVVPTDLFAAVTPPPGPVMERYAGKPWPAEGFG